MQISPHTVAEGSEPVTTTLWDTWLQRSVNQRRLLLRYLFLLHLLQRTVVARCLCHFIWQILKPV